MTEIVFPPVPWAISLIANQNYQVSSAFMGGWKVKVDTKYRENKLERFVHHV